LANAGGVIEKLHGVDVADPYRWLEDGDAPAAQAWVDEQNARTRAVLDALPGRAAIMRRLGELLEIGRVGTAKPSKGRSFYTSREGMQNQSVLYVRDGAADADRVLIDPNDLAADGTVSLDWWFPSRDGARVAYGLSKDGTEESTLYVRDVMTGVDLPDRIERTRYAAVSWMPDGTAFYYTRYPAVGSVPKEDENYFRHVFLHVLGTDSASDPRVFGEGRDKEDWPEVTVSPDGRWLMMVVKQGWSRSDVYLKDLATDGPFVPVVEHIDAMHDPIIRADALYIRTNQQAPRYRVLKVDPRAPSITNWTEIVPEGEEVLRKFSVAGDKVVGLYAHNALSWIRIFDPDGRPLHQVDLPAVDSVDGLATRWYEMDLDTYKRELSQQAKAGLDPATYDVEHVQYVSKDGTSIGMFLVHAKGLVRDGDNPLLLLGYGGFNVAMRLFGASWFVFLERGGVIALPNLRGGGEHGEAWHKAGMLENKQNVFDDVIAAAEWLIAERYTSAGRMAIQGWSNGGLLVGAALTQRPDLFRAAICQVPLLDMLRYHRFRIGKLWIPEYGDPDDPEAFGWLHAYSPYHKVEDGTPYPATLITAAASDSRVDPMHARKMTARLQAATTGEGPILMRLETQAGHGPGKPRVKMLDEMTDIWSFLFWQLGVSVN